MLGVRNLCARNVMGDDGSKYLFVSHGLSEERGKGEICTLCTNVICLPNHYLKLLHLNILKVTLAV